MSGLAFTYFRSLRNPEGQLRRFTWAAVCKWLATPVTEAAKEDCGGFSIAEYTGNRRSLANVRNVYALGLDFDKEVDLATLAEDGRPKFVTRFDRYRAFVHTTHSSTPEAPRLRVFIMLSRPVTGDEYRIVYSVIGGYIEQGGLIIDRKASDPSRFWYRPATLPSRVAEFQSWQLNGTPLDVEKALSLYVPPATPPPAPAPSHSGPVGDVISRAEKYLAHAAPAISGSDGHKTTFNLAMKLVLGFGLSHEVAYSLMAQWNLTCVPPWSERELRHKLRQAAERGTMTPGKLRDADRRSA